MAAEPIDRRADAHEDVRNAEADDDRREHHHVLELVSHSNFLNPRGAMTPDLKLSRTRDRGQAKPLESGAPAFLLVFS